MLRAPNHWGKPESPSNVASTFFNTVHLLAKDLQVRTWGRQIYFLPRALSNLGTPLLPLQAIKTKTFDNVSKRKCCWNTEKTIDFHLPVKRSD